MQPYPLQFQAQLKERVWGGRNLEQFGLPLPDGTIGEGWMIGEHPNGTTVVLNGPLAGLALNEARDKYGSTLLGAKGNTADGGRFPLLIKLLDCEDDLSVQVHPTDSYEGLPQGELGKTEMWYIVDAKPGAKIIYGLQPGMTREALAQAIAENRIMDSLQEVPVAAGDSFYIPAGTVHALKSGVIVAEIQQNSDTTYRLYDYDRPGLDGKPRELHIEHSLNVIAYDGAGATRMSTQQTEAGQWLRLAESPYFIVEKALCESNWEINSAPDSFTVLIVCEGEGRIGWSGSEEQLELKPGVCLLLPSDLSAYTLTGHLTVLRSYIP